MRCTHKQIVSNLFLACQSAFCWLPPPPAAQPFPLLLAGSDSYPTARLSPRLAYRNFPPGAPGAGAEAEAGLGAAGVGGGAGRGGQGGAGRGVSRCSCLPATQKVLFVSTPHNPTGPKQIYIKVGLARTIYIRCIYGLYGREITKYTVIYGVYIRFRPTLKKNALTPQGKK